MGESIHSYRDSYMSLIPFFINPRHAMIPFKYVYIYQYSIPRLKPHIPAQNNISTITLIT